MSTIRHSDEVETPKSDPLPQAEMTGSSPDKLKWPIARTLVVLTIVNVILIGVVVFAAVLGARKFGLL